MAITGSISEWRLLAKSRRSFHVNFGSTLLALLVTGSRRGAAVFKSLFTHPAQPELVEGHVSRLATQIKGWSRAKKEALIAGVWNRISYLARNGRGG